ncbi:MAG TPA: hypothetical protein VIA80_09630 [Hyphomonadaceae bacterium]|jgi:ABC-type Fe3+-hydroxamate transport system substrate-binding protein
MEYLAGSIVTVVVVVTVFTYLIVRMAMRYEEKKLAAKTGAGERVEQILAETQAEVSKLRERVQVLERLATDEDRRVASEISRLGDGPAIRG